MYKQVYNLCLSPDIFSVTGQEGKVAGMWER
jgi:hypothetical protein